MSKISFLFPGQGAQYVGMGREIYENYQIAREVFEEASRALGYSISDLCFNSDEETLSKTENTQVAMLTVSTAILKVIESYGIKPYAAAGLSLGEYGAIVTAGCIPFKEAVKLIKKRGRYMQQAVPEGVGSMAALLGLPEEELEEVLKKGRKFGIVEGSNFNCKGQIVIGGEIKALNEAAEAAKEKGAKAVLLKVSAPFHTSMLKEASDKFYEELKNTEIKKPEIKLCINLTGEYLKEDQDIKKVLRDGIKSPVYFMKEIETMTADGVDTFIELGPSKILSSFVKKTNRQVMVLNVEDAASLNNTLEKLKGGNSSC
ncbi:MAG: ACP S-malonyltransferase [Clostridiaceae bacterium]